MWKPVRLQGVGAATHHQCQCHTGRPAARSLAPADQLPVRLDAVRRPRPSELATGQRSRTIPTGTYSCPGTPWRTADYFTTPTNPGVPQIDRLPLEAVVGWDATVNGNLAEQLQEPSLMGAYEGAGITVLGKGVWTPKGENVWTDT